VNGGLRLRNTGVDKFVFNSNDGILDMTSNTPNPGELVQGNKIRFGFNAGISHDYNNGYVSILHPSGAGLGAVRVRSDTGFGGFEACRINLKTFDTPYTDRVLLNYNYVDGLCSNPTGTWNVLSDSRIKTNIQPTDAEQSLNRVNQLNIITYNKEAAYASA
jgi:hypothetical protein